MQPHRSILIDDFFAVGFFVFGGALVDADGFVFFHLLCQEGVDVALEGFEGGLERSEVCDAVLGGWWGGQCGELGVEDLWGGGGDSGGDVGR
jgi:hypothetical protein